MNEELVGSVATGSGSGASVNISSSDPALVVTEPTANNFNLDFDEQLSKLPFLKIDYVAGEPISALKLVYASLDGKVYVANNTATFDEALVMGVAINAAALAGDTVTIVLSGVLQDASWSWAANELLFLNSLGTITNVIPASGHRSKVGKALMSDKILIEIEEPIIL
jgi:hypothetical protein